MLSEIKKSIIHILLMFFVLFGVLSCAPQEGNISRENTAVIRELNVVPVFPPREDFQVGDVYEAIDPDGKQSHKGYDPIGVWVASLPVNDKIDAFYRSRLSFPETPRTSEKVAEDLKNDSSKLIPQEIGDGNCFKIPSTQPSRLRLVAFPSFARRTVTSGGLSAVVPVEMLNVSSSGQAAGEYIVTFSAPIAESYGLPATLVMDEYYRLSSRRIQAIYHDLCDINSKNKEVDLKVVTEVYYARIIDVSIKRVSGAGFAVTAAPVGTAAITSKPASTTQPSKSQDEIPSSTEMANQLNDELNKNLSQITPGGSARFLSASEDTITLRRTFDRPVAIGYRGLIVRIKGLK